MLPDWVSLCEPRGRVSAFLTRAVGAGMAQVQEVAPTYRASVLQLFSGTNKHLQNTVYTGGWCRHPNTMPEPA